MTGCLGLHFPLERPFRKGGGDSEEVERVGRFRWNHLSCHQAMEEGAPKKITGFPPETRLMPVGAFWEVTVVYSPKRIGWGAVFIVFHCFSLQISKQNEVGRRSGVDECGNDMQWIVMTRFGFHGFTTSRKRDLLNHIEPIWNWISLKIDHHVGVYFVARRAGDLQELSSQSNNMMICKYDRYSLANQCTNFRKNTWKYDVFPYCYVCLPCYSQDRFCSVEYAARVDDPWSSGIFRVPAGRNRIARNQPQELKLMDTNVVFSRSPQKDMFPVVGSQDKNMVDDDDVRLFSGPWNIPYPNDPPNTSSRGSSKLFPCTYIWLILMVFM